MRWRTGRRSTNVEDRRGESASPMRMGSAVGGAGILMRFLPLLMRKPKILMAIVVIGVVAHFTGFINIPALLSGGQSLSPASGSGGGSDFQASGEEQELADFISVVLADTEDTWHELFAAEGERYQEPSLVLFSGSVQSACGFAQAAMGPFYCPGDQKLYIDLSFYEDLKQRHGAPGDFAQAYVVAHEVGHHVQTLMGIAAQVNQARSRASEIEGNQIQVRMELQADCLAGIWAHHANRSRQVLERGDIQEALTAAAAIGDDRLQTQSRGYVTPESFTHGSSEQRMRWFNIGLEQGNMASCDTFSSQAL